MAEHQLTHHVFISHALHLAVVGPVSKPCVVGWQPSHAATTKCVRQACIQDPVAQEKVGDRICMLQWGGAYARSEHTIAFWAITCPICYQQS